MLNFIYVNKFINKYFAAEDKNDYEHSSNNIDQQSPNCRQMLEAIEFIDNMERELISINSFDNGKLVARYFNSNSKKIVILLHDVSKDPIAEFCMQINYFLSLGFNVLVPYQRGHFLSKFKYHSFGFLESYDLNEWVKQMIKRVGDNCSIYIEGIGIGGNAICMYNVFDVPSNVKAFLIDSPFMGLKDFIDDRISEDNLKDEDSIKLDIYKAIEKNLGFSITKSSCISAIKKDHVKTFFSCIDKEGSKTSISTQTLAAFCPTVEETLVVPCDEFDSDETYYANRTMYNKLLKKFVSDKK